MILNILGEKKLLLLRGEGPAYHELGRTEPKYTINPFIKPSAEKDRPFNV